MRKAYERVDDIVRKGMGLTPVATARVRIAEHVNANNYQGVVDEYRSAGLTEEEALIAASTHTMHFGMPLGIPDRRVAKDLLKRAGFSDEDVADVFVAMAEQDAQEAPIVASLLYELSDRPKDAERKAVEGIAKELEEIHSTRYGDCETAKRIASEVLDFVRKKYFLDGPADGKVG